MWTKTFTLILIVITSFQALSQGFRNPFGVTRLKKIQKESGQHPDSAVSFTHEMTFEKKAANRIVADSSSYNKVLSISRDQLKNSPTSRKRGQL